MRTLLVLLMLVASGASGEVAPVGDYRIAVPAADAADRFDFEVTNVIGGLWRNAGCIEVDLTAQGAGRVVDLQTTCEHTNVGFLRATALRGCILNSMAIVLPGDSCRVSFKVESALQGSDGLACLRATSIHDDNVSDNVAVDCVAATSMTKTLEPTFEPNVLDHNRCTRGRKGRCDATHAPR
jgi:hypothetical protein